MRIAYGDLCHHLSVAAYVASHSREGTASPHLLHELADVCEAGSADRTLSMMRLAFGEITTAFGRAVTEAEADGEGFRLTLAEALPPQRRLLTVEAVREYVIARTLGMWWSLLLPGEKNPQSDICSRMLSEASEHGATSGGSGPGGSGSRCLRRRLPPI